MFELAEEQLKQLGEIFVALYKKKFEEKIYPYGRPERGKGDKIATGKLRDSISSRVIETPDGLMLELSYNDYLKYVIRGRKPGKPPKVSILLAWIKSKKVNGRQIKGRNRKGKFIKDLSFAYAIQQNIRKFGIRKTEIFDKGIDALEDAFLNPPQELRDQYEALYAAIGDDVGNFITKIYEDEIKTIK